LFRFSGFASTKNIITYLKMELTKKTSNHNFFSFLWHSAFLAFASNFMDVDTIIPGMVVESGGTAMHIGIMSAIMLGGSSFTQLFFAPVISNKHYKKKFLLLGINSRILSLLGLGVMLLYFNSHHANVLWLMFIFITTFSLGGAFANVSYTDIFGKSVLPDKRKTFFSTRQILSGTIVLGSAVLAKKVLVMHGFPINYAYMFFIGATAMIIASGGFWSIKEETSSQLKISGIKSFFALLKAELKQNRRLKYFLGFINTQGIAISFLPFVILYSKQMFGTQTGDTGMFLLFKVFGVVFVSILVLLGAKKIKYNILLFTNVLLTLSMAVFAIFLSNPQSLKYIFIFGGVIYSLYSITMNGLLMEVSGTKNRTLYTGFAGAGNILPALFPLVSGAIIDWVGFKYFFILFMVIISLAAFFILKIDCKK